MHYPIKTKGEGEMPFLSPLIITVESYSYKGSDKWQIFTLWSTVRIIELPEPDMGYFK